jgi:hypothetical protein
MSVGKIANNGAAHEPQAANARAHPAGHPRSHSFRVGVYKQVHFRETTKKPAPGGKHPLAKFAKPAPARPRAPQPAGAPRSAGRAHAPRESWRDGGGNGRHGGGRDEEPQTPDAGARPRGRKFAVGVTASATRSLVLPTDLQTLARELDESPDRVRRLFDAHAQRLYACYENAQTQPPDDDARRRRRLLLPLALHQATIPRVTSLSDNAIARRQLSVRGARTQSEAMLHAVELDLLAALALPGFAAGKQEITEWPAIRERACALFGTGADGQAGGQSAMPSEKPAPRGRRR